jgi:DNA-binding transcriptional regulator PaaX
MYMTTKEGINSALKILGLTGLTGVAIAAPNATQGFKYILRKAKKNNINHQRILAELKRQGLVHILQDGEYVRYTITPAGAYRLQQLIIDEIKITIPKKWDKKWRIVSYDIPVAQSKQRMAFANKLKSFNFTMIQKSVWAHPAPCFEQLEQLAGYYNVLRYCTLFEVTKLDELTTRKLIRQYTLNT